MPTEPLSYGYAWQLPDYTASNTLYTSCIDGIVGPTDTDGQVLLPTPTMSHILPTSQEYKQFSSRPSSWLGDPHLQETLGLDLLALQSQQLPQQISKTSRSPTRHRCFDHGCNGRSYSSRSNLRRHQRERSHLTRIPPCPLCGAQFYRRWTKNQHVTRASCLRRMPTRLPFPDVVKDPLEDQSQQPQRNCSKINNAFVPDWSANHEASSPGPATSAPVPQFSRSQSAPSNSIDPSWEALSCYWLSLVNSDSSQSFDWTVRSYPGTPTYCP